MYKTTVSDGGVSNQQWVDLGSTGDRQITKLMSPDGARVVVLGFSREEPLIVINITNTTELGIIVSWNLSSSERQWPSYWGEGADEKIVRDDASISTNDRLTVDGVDYKIIELKVTRTQNTVIIQTIVVARVTNTTNW